jgi:cell wall-associated NlpC family hydrolase
MAASQPAKIDANGVNIRVSPNTTSKAVAKVSNKRVSVIDEANGWYKISFDGKTGWVLGKFISLQKVDGSINANGVNFRQGANASSKILDSLNKGTGVKILDTKAGFHKVQVGSKVGYVAMKFVSTRSSKQTSRSTEAEEVTYEDNSIAGKVIAYAKDLLGVRYVYGGKSPSGFDCSGFVGYVFKKVGIKLNSSSASMYSNGVKVSKSDLKPGDILFFDAANRGSSGTIDHVGIYLGNDKFIHASTSHGRVVTQSLSDYQGRYIGARRVI